MAVAPTGAIYKALKFDGVSSRTYGVYITGEAVYNAPERDVEMITIPGRSGSFALDKGRFENIEVTYPAGIAADTEAEFRDAISDFRNFLASRNGYVRLEDDYNPNEYRLAVYKSGLDVTPAQLRAGEFDITFDCKPQRYLKSGEDAIEVDSGDVVSNPTLFASSPMLEVEGYGEIEFNGSKVTIENALIGETLVRNGMPTGTIWTGNIILDTSLLNQGDKIYIKSPSTWGSYYDHFSATYKVIAKSEYQMQQLDTSQFVNATASMYRADSVTTHLTQSCDVVPDLYYGTASQFSSTAAYQWGWGSGIYYTVTLKLTQTFIYDGDNKISVQYSWEITPTQQEGDTEGINRPYWQGFLFPNIYGDSSKSALGTPTYIDCDLGEAYMEIDGQIVSLNRYIDLGSELPTLASGANTITFDNTITDLQIVPRWWKI